MARAMLKRIALRHGSSESFGPAEGFTDTLPVSYPVPDEAWETPSSLADRRALHELGERGPVVGVPAREGRAVLDDVVRGPEDPALVHVARDVVVRAENIEV